jgi:hypothetical protein
MAHSALGQKKEDIGFDSINAMRFALCSMFIQNQVSSNEYLASNIKKPATSDKKPDT